MPLPYLITCDLPAARLYELADGRFQFIEPTERAPFMSGYQYVLVENALASYLEALGLERVHFEPAVLFDQVSGEEFTSHTRLRVGQLFHVDQISDLALDGPRLLTMNDEYYFVSPELKELLERGSFEYLQFSEGLNGFAGA